VVLALNLKAQLLHGQHHLGADVLLLVQRRHREVAFLVAELVAQVGHLVPAGVPDGLVGVDAVEGAVAPGVELHVVEDEKLRFRAEDGALGQAGGGEVFLGLLSDGARVAVVDFAGARLGDGAG
jgi:hypothetical protein